MRIENKYLRNRASRAKHWNRIRSTEQPFKTMMPYFVYGAMHYSCEEQVKNHFEWITERARACESGHHRSFFHAPKHYRQRLWKKRKAQERAIMAHIRQGDYDAETPKFKRDADWLWF